MQCFKGEELDLLQRHEITTAEKSFMCHSNFTQGSHVVEVDIINNTVYVEPFMSRYMSIHQTTWQLFVCYSEKFYRFIRFLTNFLHGSKFINKPTGTLSSFNKQRIRSRTPCVFLFLNHKNIFFRSEEAYTVIISQWEIVFMTVMNEFCCDTSKIFCFNSLLSALTYFQICIKHSSYCDEFSSERGKKRDLWRLRV